MKPKPISLIFTSVLMLVCIIAADVFINQKGMMKEKDYSNYVAAMSPERQIHEYIQAHTQHNQLLLDALIGEGGNAEFEYKEQVVLPRRLVRMMPDDERRNLLLQSGDAYDAACFNAEIEFVAPDGSLSLHGCIFIFRMQRDGDPWRMSIAAVE